MIKKFKHILFGLALLTLLDIPINADTSIDINKALTVGKNYGIQISKKIPEFKKYSSDKLCSTVILKDLQAKNEEDFFISDILIKNYNQDFTINVFKFCLLTIDKLKDDRNYTSTNTEILNTYN